MTSRDGRVLTIRLDRPGKRNAVDADLAAGLEDALNELDDDPGLWVGVLTGTDGVFSAGTDLIRGAGGRMPRGGEYGIVRRRRTRPLIAAVDGLAYGGGFEIVLACDLVVASRTATFALPEVARGVVCTSGALFRAPRVLPLNVARELLLTGQPLGAERAWSLGLVNVLTEPGLVLPAAMELALSICKNSPSSVRATVAALDTLVAGADQDGWAATDRAIGSLENSHDLAEGLAAFREKRPPEWTGS